MTYIPALDGLRAVAISLVVVHHALMPVPFGGAIGVDVFFVLSGYLITTILLREQARAGTISLKRFYLRRIARLYPPLVLMLIVVFVPVALTTSVKSAAGGSVFALFYLMPIGLETGFQTASAYAHAWSLGVEEWFYFLWPAALVALTKVRKSGIGIVIAGTILVVSAAYIEIATDHSSYILRAYGLLAGCWLAVMLNRGWSPPNWSGITGALMLAAVVVWSTLERLSTLGVLIADVGAILIIAQTTLREGGVFARVLTWGPAVYLGRISYEVYLWHYPLLVIFALAAGEDFVNVAWLAIPVSVIAAAVAQHLTRPLIANLRNHTPI